MIYGMKVVIFMGFNMDFIKNDGKFMGISLEYHGNVNSDYMPDCLYISHVFHLIRSCEDPANRQSLVDLVEISRDKSRGMDEKFLEALFAQLEGHI